LSRGVHPGSPPGTAGPVTAAAPGFHRHAGIGLAIAIVAAMLGVMLLAAVVGESQGRSLSSFYLGALIATAPIAGASWFMVWIFDRLFHDPRQRHLMLVKAYGGLAIVIGLWMLLMPALISIGNIPGFLLSLPTSGFALWVLRRIQRNRKEPWWLVLVAVAWGGVVATNFAMVTESAYSGLVDSHIIPGPGTGYAEAFNAALFEEVGKGLAVVLLFILFRNRFDGVVSGIVIGAAVGLGFNFQESIGYSAGGFGPLLFQWWARQVVGLFLGHVTYTALIGAGIGVARQQRRTWRKAVCILSGFVVAIAAHFLWDAFAMTRTFWDSGDPVLSAFVFLPLDTILIDGPFALMVIALLLLGLHDEGAALQVELAGESATGQGAVTPAEVRDLASPWHRLRARTSALFGGGFGRYRWLRRLQEAQLDLAMERWHRARQELDEPQEAEAHLRQKVLALKGRAPVARAAPAAR
jgi:RsiW-degrading membrane proteinase PrsW (M82 family)